MATPRDALVAQLERISLQEHVLRFIPIFEFTIDVEATAALHSDVFGELKEYMEVYMGKYTVHFDDSEKRWVPADLVKHTYRSDKKFRLRFLRFVKGLTDRDYRVVEDDALEELELGSYGNDFISWEMTLVLMVLEGGGKEKGKADGKAKRTETAIAREEDAQEEHISEQSEALMALVLMQTDQQVDEEEDVAIEGDEVLEEAPDLAIPYLHPIVIDGVEFLILDDINKALGLREDESLSVLAMHAGMRHPTNPSVDQESFLNFDEPTALNLLEYRSFKAESTLEETVIQALVEIKGSAHMYENVPGSAFVPHAPYTVQGLDDSSSFNLMKPELIEADDLVEV